MWFLVITLQVVLGSCPDTLIETVGTNTLVDYGGGVYGPSVTVPIHSTWVTLPGCPWIWGSTNLDWVGTISFSLKFLIASWDLQTAARIYLEMAADDHASVWINGVQIAFNDNTYHSSTQYDLLPYLTGSDYNSGINENTLKFKVTNTGGPGGFTYRIVMTYP